MASSRTTVVSTERTLLSVSLPRCLLTPRTLPFRPAGGRERDAGWGATCWQWFQARRCLPSCSWSLLQCRGPSHPPGFWPVFVGSVQAHPLELLWPACQLLLRRGGCHRRSIVGIVLSIRGGAGVVVRVGGLIAEGGAHHVGGEEIFAVHRHHHDLKLVGQTFGDDLLDQHGILLQDAGFVLHAFRVGRGGDTDAVGVGVGSYADAIGFSVGKIFLTFNFRFAVDDFG